MINKILKDIDKEECYYVGTNGCLYQDLGKEELLAIKQEIERLNELLDYANDEVVSYANECIRLNDIIKEVREYIKKYRTMVDGYEDKDTGQMVYEHRLKLNKHQVRKLLEILERSDKVGETDDSKRNV